VELRVESFSRAVKEGLGRRAEAALAASWRRHVEECAHERGSCDTGVVDYS
jgi:hypothetical protein